MDDGLSGVGHVCDDTVSQNQQDEVLLRWVRHQATRDREVGRQGQYQVPSVHIGYSNSDNRFFLSTCV